MGLLSRLAYPFARRHETRGAGSLAVARIAEALDRTMDITDSLELSVVDLTNASNLKAEPEKELVSVAANGKSAGYLHDSCTVRHRTPEAAARCRNR